MEKNIKSGGKNTHGKSDFKNIETFSRIAADQYPPLVLAYIGDAVFEVYVRKLMIMTLNAKVNKLHRASSSLVKAKAQSRMARSLSNVMTDKEKNIYKRGRNAKSTPTAKNSSVGDYRRATGFEALLGYLYMDNQKERLLEIMEKAVCSEFGKNENG